MTIKQIMRMQYLEQKYEVQKLTDEEYAEMCALLELAESE